jgi:cell division transport system ATP-binding protein
MIKTEHVSKVYKGDVKALVDINIEISKGEFVFLVGASGSGKSTLTKVLTKDEDVTEGEVYVAGRPLNRLPKWRVPYLRRALGVVFQDFKLLENKSVYENVSFALEVIGYSEPRIRPLVLQTLDLVGLSDKLDRRPNELSGGEQQRVSIARAFVNRPQILIADEPTGNLDPGTSLEIIRLLDRINRTGTTVLMATHDHAIVDAMRRRVIELEGGHVVRDQDRGVYGPRE